MLFVLFVMGIKDHNLEIEKIIGRIKTKKAKQVLLQFPDGLKPYSTEIAEKIEKETKANCVILLGSCFGACDLPQTTLNFDLLVQFGHSAWKNY